MYPRFIQFETRLMEFLQNEQLRAARASKAAPRRRVPGLRLVRKAPEPCDC